MYKLHIIFLSFLLMVVIDVKWDVSTTIINFKNISIPFAEKGLVSYSKLSDTDYLVVRAKTYFEANKHDEALIDLNTAIMIDPQFYLAHLNRGMLYYTLGKYEEAIDNFSTCIEITPTESRAYFNRAFAYLELGKEADYISDLNVFLALSKNESLKNIIRRKLEDT